MDTVRTKHFPLSPGLGRAYGVAERAAKQVVQRRFKVLRLTKNAYVKLGRNQPALSRVSSDLYALVRMIRAWAKKEYSHVPWRAIICAVAAVIYFVNPADLIPDILAGLGFVDDAAVVTTVVRSIHRELGDFRQWEKGRSPDHVASVTPLRERPAA